MGKNKNKGYKADNLADALKQAQAAQEVIDVKNYQPCGFSYRQETGGGYGVYLGTKEREVLAGRCANEAQAAAAVAELEKHAATPPVKVKITPTRGKVNASVMKQIQATCLALDPARRIRFRETMIAINYLLHMMTDAIDENAALFDIMFDNEGKQRIKTINKQLDRLLDNVYTSGVMGDNNEDYTAVTNAAYSLRERIELFLSYVVPDTWRFNEMKKALQNVLPDSYVNAARAEIAAQMETAVIGDTPITTKVKC